MPPFLLGARMDVLVIGAGVVGLAIARALALAGHAVVVAEKTGGIGNGVSSRNSEVIHGGMYYPSGSLRARHCVAGRRLLYEFCATYGVPHRKCGKLIVATNDLEQAKIEGIYQQGMKNGVEGLSFLSGEEARALEPSLACTGAVLSQETGIIDSHALMLALEGDLESHGGAIAFHTPVERLARAGSGWKVSVGGADPGDIVVDAVVNTASLGAQAIARATQGYPAERVPKLVLAKGNYFGCLGKSAFSRLIYPAPVDGGLGTHVTLDLAGRMRFGPDVEWIDAEDYAVDPQPRRKLLCLDQALLARPAGRSARRRLCRRPPETLGPRRAGRRFRHRRACRARTSRPRPPLRHRKPRPHLLAVDRG